MRASTSTTIAAARFPEDVDAVRGLFEEYIDSLGIDLSFQNVAAELTSLPGKYASPDGAVLLARDVAGMPLGCVALRPWTQADTGEIKRLYVRPAARGQALGSRLAEAVIDRARRAGYARLVLDTLASMRPALRIYDALGFRPVPAYYANPLPDTVYLALDLQPVRARFTGG